MVTIAEERVVRPPDTAAVSAVLAEATEAGRTVAVRGAGTKDHWGGPLVPADVVLATTRLTGVVMHEPDDLVATVRAGTPLRDLQAVLGLQGQRLALSSGYPQATVGGVLSTGEAGPLRLRHGAGRDLLIGVEFVRADGVVAHAGGRVVKNVAGYDLGRLLCGAYGTVGVITEATFKLQPIPPASAWVVAPLASEVDLAPLATAAQSPSVAPSAIEVDLGPDGAGSLAVLVEGTPAGVAARAAALVGTLGPRSSVVDEAPAGWGDYPFGPGDVGLTIASPVSALPTVIATLRRHLDGAVRVRGSAGAGVVHAAVAPTVPVPDLATAVREVRALLDGSGGSCVLTCAPETVTSTVDRWGPVAGLALMRRVKAQFDPAGRFAAGRFVGGI